MKKQVLDSSLAQLLTVVALCSTMTGTAVSAQSQPPNQREVSEPEALPTPEAYRASPYRDPPVRPSYDPRDAYDGLRSSKRSDEYYSGEEETFSGSSRLENRLRRVLLDRQGGGGFGGGPKTNQRLHETDEEYEAAATSTSYGGHGSDSGYGLTCTSGYVNASAVALLAFLFLLNIVQDVITQITMGRRKRDVPEQSPLEQFLGDGGLSALYQELPGVLVPLMVKLSDSEHPDCIQHPLCEANLQLASSYGPVGRVVGSLVSNIAAKTYSGARAHHFDGALAAAGAGRAGSCNKIAICPRGGKPVSWKFGVTDAGEDEKPIVKEEERSSGNEIK